MKYTVLKVLVPVLAMLVQVHEPGRSRTGGSALTLGVGEARADGDDDDDDDDDDGDDGQAQAVVDAANCAAQQGVTTATGLGVSPSAAVGIASSAYGAISPGISVEGLSAAIGPAATQAAIGYGVDATTAAAIGDAMSAAALAGCSVTS